VVAQGRTVAQGTVSELSARTGLTDFEETFVQLAFGGAAQSQPMGAAASSAASAPTSLQGGFA